VKPRHSLLSVAVILASLSLCGGNSTTSPTTQPAPQNPSTVPSTTLPTSIDLHASAIELEYDPLRGFVDQSKSNAQTLKLFSLYRGKLYLVNANVVLVDIAERTFFSPIIESDAAEGSDVVFFRVLPGESIPAHPGCQVLKTRFDVNDSQFNYKLGRKFEFAFTGSGTCIFYWPAEFSVVPTAYDEGLDDPTKEGIKVPPAYQLIPPTAK
jgi:hypothetical protein